MATVPDQYDVVINSQGYMLADLEDVKAQYGYTPTFVPRSNTQGDYGDNFQDFWLTFSQNDWSLGDAQRFYRSDEVRRRRYWRSTALDISIDGRATMRGTSATVAAGTVTAMTEGVQFLAWLTTATNLKSVTSTGTLTDIGAHGCTVSPKAIVFDGVNVYICGDGGLLREYATNTASFSTFSATPSINLAFLNNTLYGGYGRILRRYDTAGTATTLHEFVGADGTTTAGIVGIVDMKPFGGDLLMLVSGQSSFELWIYDGTGVAIIAQLPNHFYAHSLAVVDGIVYVGGILMNEGSTADRIGIYYYVNGSFGQLWRSERHAGVSPNKVRVTGWSGGIAFTDDTRLGIMHYNTATGGTSEIVNLGYTPGELFLASMTEALLLASGSGTPTTYRAPTSTTATTAELITSLIDFDSTLTKVFRGITVDYDAGTDGNGGTVDVWYRLNDLDSTYNQAAGGLGSGVETLLSNQSGRSISVKVVLNKGTSTRGPVLKRIGVRAVPKQAAFRRETFVIQCTGRDGASPLERRDGTLEPKDGLTLATALRTAATTTNPISITDEFGTFDGVIEADGFQVKRVRPNEFLAVVPVREV